MSRLPMLALGVGVLLLFALVTDARGYSPGGDWRHLAQVAGRLSTRTPERPMVYLLGGSAARECTIDDRSWRTDIRKAGGPDTLAYNLGATGQTYEDNLVLIEMLPRVPSIVIIGVNVGRYTRTGARDLPDVDPVLTPYSQHRFTQSRIATDAGKRALLTDWLTRRYPVFQDRFAHSAGKLDALVARCIELGFHPVMLNLPLNLQIVQHRMDAPRKRYREHCQDVAAAVQGALGELAVDDPAGEPGLRRQLASRRAWTSQVAAPPHLAHRHAAQALRHALTTSTTATPT